MCTGIPQIQCKSESCETLSLYCNPWLLKFVTSLMPHLSPSFTVGAQNGMGFRLGGFNSNPQNKLKWVDPHFG